MAHGSRRALLALVCVLGCSAALPASSGAVTVGIGDETPYFMSDPLFKALNIHEARFTVSWDVAVNPKRSGELQADSTWLRDAAANGITPLVSFSGIGNYIPNVHQYRRAVVAFLKKFPQVKRYTAWNEPDWIYRSLGKKPKLAAQFFNALAKHCHHCTLLAGDVYLGASALKPWLKTYVKYLRARPSGWALHNYFDVRSHTTSQLRTVLKLTHGPVWLDEIAGVEYRGHWPFPKHQSAAAAGRDEKFLFSLPHRFHRVTHIYHYLWQAVPGLWDSGLLSASGQPRPAYYVVQRAAR